ncbi:hypothetical protein GCM10009860_11110 [Microbacterium mitrae]
MELSAGYGPPVSSGISVIGVAAALGVAEAVGVAEALGVDVALGDGVVVAMGEDEFACGVQAASRLVRATPPNKPSARRRLINVCTS